MFLWLVWGLLVIDLGFIYTMLLEDYLQYEKQRRGKGREAKKRVGRSRKAGKQRPEKQRSREREIRRNMPKTEKNRHPL